jgi:hypothetical protein
MLAPVRHCLVRCCLFDYVGSLPFFSLLALISKVWFEGSFWYCNVRLWALAMDAMLVMNSMF